MNLKNLYLIIAVIAIILFFRQCSITENLKADFENTQTYLQDSVKYYQNELGEEIAYRSILKGENEKLELLYSKQRDSTGQFKRLAEKYRSVAAGGSVSTITIIDTLHFPYEVPVPCEFERTWFKNEPHFKINGLSNHLGVSINKIEIPNTLSFVAGERRLGFFKREERIEVVNSNPFIKTTGIDFYIREQKIKRFALTINPISFDLINLQYSANISLGYKLFEF